MVALANPSWLGMLPAFTEPVFNIALHCIQLHFHQLHCTDNNQTDKIWVTKIIQALWAPTSGRASWFREHLICSHIRWVFGTNEPTDKAVLWVGGRAVLRLPPLFCLGHDYFWSSFQSKNVYLTAECMNKFILILIEIRQCFDFMSRTSLPFYAAYQIFLLGLHKYKIWLNWQIQELDKREISWKKFCQHDSRVEKAKSGKDVGCGEGASGSHWTPCGRTPLSGFDEHHHGYEYGGMYWWINDGITVKCVSMARNRDGDGWWLHNKYCINFLWGECDGGPGEGGGGQGGDRGAGERGSPFHHLQLVFTAQ